MRRPGIAQSEFIAAIRRVAMAFEEGKSSTEAMVAVLKLIKDYDRNVPPRTGVSR